MRKRKQIIAENQVSEMHTFLLGGYRQKVLIEGKREDLPVVIFLHGGPGTPLPFNAGCRGLFPAFTDRFIMVYWDQLGCGINHCRLENSLTVSSFVAMARDLVLEIKKRFSGNRIFLFSVSWGSVLSARLLESGTDLDGVVVYGQITHDLFFNAPLEKALEASGIPAARLEKIRKIQKGAVQPKDLQYLSQCLQKYTDGYFHHAGKNPPLGPVLWGMIRSPDYRLRDFKAIQINGYTRNTVLAKNLWTELLSLDLSAALAGTKVPCHMIQGDSDIVATTEFVQKLAESAENSNLTWEKVPDSGHFPNRNGMDRILQALTEISSR